MDQPYLIFITTAIGFLVFLWLKEVLVHSRKNISIEKFQALSPNEQSSQLKNVGTRNDISRDTALRVPAGMIEETAPLNTIVEEPLKQIVLAPALQEWQGKYQKLEELFQEKSSELENVEKALVVEIKNRREFEKMRELLERRILDLKEKNHELQVELARLKSEHSLYPVSKNL